MSSETPVPNPGIVYIDSDLEQEAWLIATFGPQDLWRVESQTWQATPEGARLEVLEVVQETGERVSVSFGEAAPDESLTGEGRDRTGEMEELMHRASEFAEANPPHHPGSLPRFPVPSPSYANAVALPLAILAVDDEGQRGLFAPPRQVAIQRSDASLVGVGEFPGFDPDDPGSWPPPRLGSWPPPQLEGMSQIQLQAIIARFSACWSRVLDAWFAGVVEANDVLRADIREGMHRRSVLDLMEMLTYYDRLNPVFSSWLNDMIGPDTKAEETR